MENKKINENTDLLDINDKKNSNLDDLNIKPLNSQKIKQARKNLNYYDDDRTLELNDLELDKTIQLDMSNSLTMELTEEETKKIIDEAFKLDHEELKYDIEVSIAEDKMKHRIKGSISIFLFFISIFFLPLLISLEIVHSHSTFLITNKLACIVVLLIVFFIVLSLVSLLIIIKNKLFNRLKKMSLIKYIYYIVFIIYSVICSVFLVLLYGPTYEFRDWLVTTSMATKSHQYYCKWFYNKKEIAEVYTRNYIKEFDESTNADLINIKKSFEDIHYDNKYEEQVLKKDNPDDLYKIISFELNGCQAYLAVIYDPSLVKVTTTNRVGVMGQYVIDMAKRENALVAINGSGFHDPNYSSSGGSPKGITIVNGKVITNNQYGRVSTGGLIGLTNDNKLVLMKNVTAQEALKKGVRDAVSWGPFLIVNGQPAITKGNGGYGYAARTAIGQRSDGIILLLVVDSNYNRTKGANMVNLMEIMVNYGAINAANLDGGTSSVMVVEGKMISHPIDGALNKQTRPIATSIIVKKD